MFCFGFPVLCRPGSFLPGFVRVTYPTARQTIEVNSTGIVDK